MADDWRNEVVGFDTLLANAPECALEIGTRLDALERDSGIKVLLSVHLNGVGAFQLAAPPRVRPAVIEREVDWHLSGVGPRVLHATHSWPAASQTRVTVLEQVLGLAFVPDDEVQGLQKRLRGRGDGPVKLVGSSRRLIGDLETDDCIWPSFPSSDTVRCSVTCRLDTHAQSLEHLIGR